MALMKHRGLFELLETQGQFLLDSKFQSGLVLEDDRIDPASVSTRVAIETMLEELAPNLWEDDLDRLVDFGHLISPELEMVFSLRQLHILLFPKGWVGLKITVFHWWLICFASRLLIIFPCARYIILGMLTVWKLFSELDFSKIKCLCIQYMQNAAITACEILNYLFFSFLESPTSFTPRWGSKYRYGLHGVCGVWDGVAYRAGEVQDRLLHAGTGAAGVASRLHLCFGSEISVWQTTALRRARENAFTNRPRKSR